MTFGREQTIAATNSTGNAQVFQTKEAHDNMELLIWKLWE